MGNKQRQQSQIFVEHLKICLDLGQNNILWELSLALCASFGPCSFVTSIMTYNQKSSRILGEYPKYVSRVIS